jgi:hypothetical protein
MRGHASCCVQASRQQLQGLWEALKGGDRDGSGKMQPQQFTAALLAAVPGLEQAQVSRLRLGPVHACAGMLLYMHVQACC